MLTCMSVYLPWSARIHTCTFHEFYTNERVHFTIFADTSVYISYTAQRMRIPLYLCLRMACVRILYTHIFCSKLCMSIMHTYRSYLLIFLSDFLKQTQNTLTGCIVDIGHGKTSVSVVEDGVCIPSTCHHGRDLYLSHVHVVRMCIRYRLDGHLLHVIILEICAYHICVLRMYTRYGVCIPSARHQGKGLHLSHLCVVQMCMRYRHYLLNCGQRTEFW